MGTEFGEIVHQGRLVRSIGADQHAAPWLLAGAETQHDLAVEIHSLGAEHGAQHEGGVGLQRFPEPGVRMQPAGADRQIVGSRSQGSGGLCAGEDLRSGENKQC